MTQRSLLTALVASIAVAGLAWFLLVPEFDHFGELDPGATEPDPGASESEPPPDASKRRASDSHDLNTPSGVSIEGRVLDASGNGVVGIRLQWARQSRDEEISSSPDASAHVVTGTEGRFAITGLSAGAYRIEALGAGYAPVRRSVMAPSSSLALVVHEEFDLVVTGEVTDSRGGALEGVRLSTASGESSTTATDGRYRLAVKVTRAPGAFLALSAEKPGYADQHKTVPFDGRVEESEAVVSFRLLKVEDAAWLRGLLVDTEGRVVAGETLHLDNPIRNLSYRTRSIEDGTFLFENVRAARDFRLRVYPTRLYRDHTIELDISAGANDIDVTLEPLLTGVLNGILVDARGAPLPDFSLTVRSEEARANPVTVTSDAAGRFRATGVPAGKLIVETLALPKVTVRGLDLDANQELTAELPIGVGDRTVSGRVSLPGGAPAVGARVVVAWSRREKPIQSTLYAETLTDATGRFSLNGLGPGACSLSVMTTGLETLRRSIDLPEERDPDPLMLEMR